MAIQKAMRIMTWGVADGVSTSFTIDLVAGGTPYWIGTAQPGGVGGRATNWLTDLPPSKGPNPVGVQVVVGALFASLLGTVVTINVPDKPAGTRYPVTLDLLFA